MRKKICLIVLIAIILIFSGCRNKYNNVNPNIQNNKETKTADKSNITTEKNIQQSSIKNNDNLKNTQGGKELEESNKNSIKQENLENIKEEVYSSDKNSKEIVIVLDPGHANKSDKEKEPIAPGSSNMKIKETGGAYGVVTGMPEYVLNMNIALNLKRRLEGKGYKVVMTKTEHSTLLGNVKRAEIGNEVGADLVIRIHADSNNDRSINGASMLVPSSVGYAKDIYKESREYGEIVLKELIEKAGMKNRGIKERKDITGFNWSKVPVILVEVGFLSNEKEDKLLSTESYQDKIAEGLFNGIVKAIK